MEKRKVLFVVHQLNYGGVQKAAISALNAIDYSKNEVTLYVRKNRIQLMDDVNKNISQVIVNEDQTHYYRKLQVIWWMLWEYLGKALRIQDLEKKSHEKIVEYINQKQMEFERRNYFSETTEYDVAIAYIQGYTAKFVAQYIKAKKKVLFYHLSVDEKHSLHEKIFPLFDSIIGVNKNIQKMLCGLYPENAEMMSYIDNYVDVEPIKANAQDYEIARKERDIVLCSCGRMSSEKGFDLAVEAADILKRKGISFLWYFVGDGAERAKIERTIEQKGLTEDILITGMLGNPYPHIAGCDIYVQPSYEESFGLTIAEAKILCKPIVSTQTVGGNLQILQENSGILTEISGQAIADGILKYIQNTELRSKVIRSLEQIDYSKSFKEYQYKWEQLLGD